MFGGLHDPWAFDRPWKASASQVKIDALLPN